MTNPVKFVSEKQIPPRKASGGRKYQTLYDALRKKPGKWAEVDSRTKATLDARTDGVRSYPNVSTMKRGDRYFAAFVAPKSKQTRKQARKTKKAARK